MRANGFLDPLAGTRAPSLLIAVTLCVAPGCGPQAEVASSGAASTLPATTPSMTPLPVIDAVNALPTTMDAAAIWRGLAASVKVQAIAAMPRPIRWHIPACY